MKFTLILLFVLFYCFSAEADSLPPVKKPESSAVADHCIQIRDKFLDDVEMLKTSKDCRKLLSKAIKDLMKKKNCKDTLNEMREKGPMKCNAVGRI